MTSRSTILALLAISFVGVSCKKDLEPQESSLPLASASNNAVQPTAQPAAAQPQQIQPQQMQVQPQQVQQQVQKVAPGMNPAHGQPGHRCDIPVGSPLSQPVKTATAASAATQITSVKPTQPVVKTAPGMNPPHGQPGNRCDIPVGTPLSQPVKTSSVQTVAGGNGQPATITPSIISSDGKVTPGTGVKITTSQTPAAGAPALLQDPNAK